MILVAAFHQMPASQIQQAEAESCHRSTNKSVAHQRHFIGEGLTGLYEIPTTVQMVSDVTGLMSLFEHCRQGFAARRAQYMIE